MKRKRRKANPVLAELRISEARRLLAVVSLTLLGAILVYHGLSSPERGMGVRAFAIVLGTGCLWQAWQRYANPKNVVILTEEGLFDNAGDLVCTIGNIGSVDRGLFAFKPTNGFLIRLRKSESFRWTPGLYWRLGKRVGVGGATRSAEAKVMADILKTMISDPSLRA